MTLATIVGRAALLLLAAPVLAADLASGPADRVYLNGVIFTADARNSFFTALAIRDGRVLYVGSDAALDRYIAGLAADIAAQAVFLTGSAGHELAEQSRSVDLMLVGSRGYGPLRAVLAGGVSGRVIRGAHCPVIVVPRGVETPLGELFGAEVAAKA